MGKGNSRRPKRISLFSLFGKVAIGIAIAYYVFNRGAFLRFVDRLERATDTFRETSPQPSGQSNASDRIQHEDPLIVEARMFQETSMFLKRLESTYTEYWALSRKLQEQDSKFRFGSDRFTLGPDSYLAHKWSDRKNNYHLGYTQETLSKMKADFVRASEARISATMSQEDRQAIESLHKYAGALLGIPFDPVQKRFQPNLKAVADDAPEIVVEEFRVILRAAEGG